MSPAQVGLPEEGPRRTAGLRRNEVAMLAGVSEGYYARLEQGREKHPSDQVLNALTRVFGLDAEAADHLHQLARHTARGRASVRPHADDQVAAHLVGLIAAWSTPALVLGARLDILAANDAGTVLFSVMGTETNLLRFVFLAPAARRFYPEWEETAGTFVAALRAASSLGPEDAALRSLAGQLSADSAEFAGLWAAYDIRARTYGTKRLLHPEAGELTLSYQSFGINGTPGHRLDTYQAEPGSPSEAALRDLVSARRPPDRRDSGTDGQQPPPAWRRARAARPRS